MESKKDIFFDIDGTLLPAGGVVPKSTIEALNLAQSNGHKVFINTGRSRNIVPDNLLNLGFDGIVAGTGSYGEYKGEVVFKKYFTEEQVSRVIDLLYKNNIPMIMSSAKECVAPKKDIPRYLEIFSDGKIKAEDVKSMDDIDSPFFDSIKPIVCDDDIENYTKKYHGVADFIFADSPLTVYEINDILGPDINVSKASFKVPDDYSGEITIAQCTKATGILEMIKFLGDSWEDTIAVGDGFNDLEMLKGASLSIAMGNSPDEVKEVANYITDDIDNDGVYNALKHFNII